MRYLLLISIVINIILLLKILALRSSVKELKRDFSERKDLRSNTLIGVSSRDKELRSLASEMNDTLEALRLAYNKYDQGDAELKTAITNIAHDLRTPLTAICGYTELALKKGDTDETEKYLEIIAERAGHMRKLTEELFEYSVITGGEVSEEKQKLQIEHVLEDCIMNFYPALEERGIKPVVDISEEPVVRQLYPSYVERIFSNLVNNALKYSDGDLEISLTEQGSFRIANTASALTNVDANKLFDRFFTVETARNDSSHGLGLSIVKLFTERMNCPLRAFYENGKLVIEIDF